MKRRKREERSSSIASCSSENQISSQVKYLARPESFEDVNYVQEQMTRKPVKDVDCVINSYPLIIRSYLVACVLRSQNFDFLFSSIFIKLSITVFFAYTCTFVCSLIQNILLFEAYKCVNWF